MNTSNYLQRGFIIVWLRRLSNTKGDKAFGGNLCTDTKQEIHTQGPEIL